MVSKVAVFPNDLNNWFENAASSSSTKLGELPSELTQWLFKTGRKGAAKMLGEQSEYDPARGCVLAGHETIKAVKTGIADVIQYFGQALNDQGLPREVATFAKDLPWMSFSQALAKAQAWQKWTDKNMANLPAGSERTVFEHGDVKIIELMNKEALAFEAKRMGHCIGNGDYDDAFAGRNGFRQYSVRDSKNRPHCTVEVWEEDGVAMVVDCEGKVKGDLLAEPYRSCVRDFIMANNFDTQGGNYAHGLLKRGDSYMEWTDLKDGTEWVGDLDLSYYPKPLPKDLKVVGDLIVKGIPDLKLPKGLEVATNLHIHRSTLTGIDPSVSVGGRVSVEKDKPGISYRQLLMAFMRGRGRVEAVRLGLTL